MSTATLTHADGVSVVARARVQIPAWGCWWADVDLQDGVELDAGASVTIALADAALVGAVVAGGEAYGRAAYRIVAGAGGWRTPVPASGYSDDAGVRRSTVLADVAAAVGETLADAPTTRVGAHFAVHAGLASAVLHELAPRAWYVGLDGVTRFGARAATDYEGDDTRTATRPREGVVELAVDAALAALVPGASVDGGAAATDVEWALAAKRLTARVYEGVAPSRDLDAFRRVLDALDPFRAYRAAYEYRVVTQDGDALNLQPVRASSGMPDLASVPVRLVPGYSAEHVLGSLVTVAFLDGDPSRPRVVTGDDAGAPGHTPTSAELDASTSLTVGASATTTKIGPSPRLGVARMTDPVIAGPFAGTITSGSLKVSAG